MIVKTTNPLILQEHSSTFDQCTDCLSFVIEVYDTAIGELSGEALRGMLYLMACVRQAIEHKANQADADEKTAQIYEHYVRFEEELHSRVRKKLGKIARTKYSLDSPVC